MQPSQSTIDPPQSTPFAGPKHTLRNFIFALLIALACLTQARATTTIDPIPEAVASQIFRVTVNGHTSPVLHAATGYYLLNFSTDGPATISVTAQDPHFWDAGVQIQPMRLGIRPTRHGATITFPIAGPGKLTISRPGDHFADAILLFLFANPPDQTHITAQTPGIRYYAPGVRTENIDAHTGDTIYLAPGAVIFGSLNIVNVQNVHVRGTGTIIYDGPQNPLSDEGWMQKPNWHVVFIRDSSNIEIDGITAITRSRSWQLQMKDSHHIGFFNIKAIGGNPNDANQDGMDWLGGGDTTVRNSFFRASDDVFALQGNWDGYDLALLTKPGHDVRNITIEDSVVSTSISNTIRVAWPQKTFNSSGFHMANMDIVDTGYGACKVPFAFFELWADPDGHGIHQDYTFTDIRLDDWYSLLQIRQPAPSVRNIAFRHIWAMDAPALVAPTLKGDVAGITLTDTTLQGYEGAQPELLANTPAPQIAPATLQSTFTYTEGILHPHQPITFTAAEPDSPNTHFHWLFGDGTQAEGHQITHTFPDAEGTLLDHTGRFRVLLHITTNTEDQTWSNQSVVLGTPRPPSAATTNLIRIPADGGYTFTVLTSTEATLSLDGQPPLTSPKGRPQVCGAEGNAVQSIRLSAVLTKGPHQLLLTRKPGIENATPQGEPVLLWEGPNLPRQPVPKATYSAPGSASAQTQPDPPTRHPPSAAPDPTITSSRP